MVKLMHKTRVLLECEVALSQTSTPLHFASQITEK